MAKWLKPTREKTERKKMQDGKFCCSKLVGIGNTRREVKKNRRQNREHLGTSFRFMANVFKGEGKDNFNL